MELKIQIKNKNITPKEIYILFSPDAIEKLNLKIDTEVKIYNDEHGYLSLYVIPDLEGEKGWNVSRVGTNSRGIYGDRVTDFFELNDKYIIENPEWDKDIERMVYELNPAN